MDTDSVSQKEVLSTKDGLHFSLRSIPFSHYNEKARWALDYFQIPYVEYRSLPMCHMISMFKYRAKGAPWVAEGSPFVTPFLMVTPTTAAAGKKLEAKECITFNDSTAIMSFLSDQYGAPAGDSKSAPTSLYSNNEETKAKILALEDRFDKMIGPHVRRYVYYEALIKSPKKVGRALGHHDNAGKLQSWIWSLFFPLISYILIKLFHVNDASAARSKDIIRREFEHISRVLESGPPGPAYLIGNQFTAADLTLASLAAMVVGVLQEDGYGAWVPPVTEWTPEAQSFCQELRKTTAGKHVVECYKLHRGQKAPGSSYGFNFFGLW
ncbi:hypothetical protein BX616_011335 [Lobosporangium transversale]|uniref:GST C-terminal domain-containing protein n=1 Tax=Lobosporangium transversale TaxID=64571 RepID=A0A1Y2GGR4_9FUNG|nr:hypothetical protein BCR41DRAFT_357912 [Lobosporangium transversale]KAF9908929.1 hypothetical protein BX616_011335 [Lobosporangium transversale]ORZ10378.1 hypothetical protein BCR41DRAFT_357912 [Lobosporangium transversale]|eukprot:XP_021879285.1 hypothetical protein BCR41DRAFT_357912 [Lobosporangium transversale]